MKSESKQKGNEYKKERGNYIMQFNDAQLQAITSEKALILVSAGAGSGKTRVLTERFIHLCELRLKSPDHPVGATDE
jgi:ATP-dependent exoDNAse (exonuclease V) beta subunit